MSEKRPVSRSPRNNRFHKGQSGNPNGRPKKAQAPAQASAFDIVMDKTLTVTQGGKPREVTVEEALQHQLYQQAIAGSRAASNHILKMILKREAYLAKKAPAQTMRVSYQQCFYPENAEEALVLLGTAKPHPEPGEPGAGKRCRDMLERWPVQAAITRRRGGGKLTKEEVQAVQAATSAPETLQWPNGAAT